MQINNYIFFSIAGLINLILLMIIFFSKKRKNLFENNIYILLMFCTLFGIINEIVMVYCVPFLELHLFIKEFVAKLFLVITEGWIFLLCLYTAIVSNNLVDKKTINLKKQVFLLTILYCVLAIITCCLPIEYAYNDTGTSWLYTYGPSTKLVFVTAIIFIGISLLYIFKTKNKTRKFIPVYVYTVLSIIVSFIQQIDPNLLMISFMETVIILLMYFTIENPDVKMVNELEYAKNMAEKANRAKSDFLSSMSHEIRTPLNAIVGLSECIKNSDDIEEIHEDANDVVMASQNLLEIVNGILDISKIEADKMEIIESNYNPLEVLKDLTTIAETRIGEKEIELRCNFAEDLPNSLYGDQGKLKQIITNMLSNAVKYTEKGHIDFNVSCINEKDKCKLQIIISDTGRGIKPEQMDTIFNKFERAEEDKNSTIEGTGLGLAITKSLVEMMGGKILVHSTYGEGSKFTVFLEQKYSKGEENTKVVKDEKISYSDKKALIVDDNKLNIKVASKVLSEFELNIDSADSGFSAIEKIENNEHYDIIFMDIMMPKMSGVETLKKLKDIDGFNTPVVALTADAMEGKSTKYIEVGFNDYLSKPINKDELKRVLDKCLNGTMETEEEKVTEEDPHIHRVIPITDEDIEMLNKKLAEDLAKQKEQEEREKNNI
ncbi:MAG: response regulator [Firmicutes bacterium]|nr:response regulator [Bacillota bacterium]